MFKIGRLVFFKNKQYTIHSVKLQESYPISLDNYLTFTLKGFRYNDEGNFGSDYERIYLCNVLKTRFNKLKYLNFPTHAGC
jgi:hypothetical protein